MTQGPGTARAMPDILIGPKDCALVLVDQQAGLAFGVGSIDRQMLLNNVIALARTATDFRHADRGVHVRHQGLQRSPDARDSTPRFPKWSRSTAAT